MVGDTGLSCSFACNGNSVFCFQGILPFNKNTSALAHSRSNLLQSFVLWFSSSKTQQKQEPFGSCFIMVDHLVLEAMVQSIVSLASYVKYCECFRYCQVTSNLLNHFDNITLSVIIFTMFFHK